MASIRGTERDERCALVDMHQLFGFFVPQPRRGRHHLSVSSALCWEYHLNRCDMRPSAIRSGGYGSTGNQNRPAAFPDRLAHIHPSPMPHLPCFVGEIIIQVEHTNQWSLNRLMDLKTAIQAGVLLASKPQSECHTCKIFSRSSRYRRIFKQYFHEYQLMILKRARYSCKMQVHCFCLFVRRCLVPTRLYNLDTGERKNLTHLPLLRFYFW